jgi:hypothetical protein
MPVQPTTAPASPTPDVPAVVLRVEVLPDLAGGAAPCPGCDGAFTAEDVQVAAATPLGLVLLGVDRVIGDERTALAEAYVGPDADGIARLSLALEPEAPAGTSYEVTLLHADGFTLCPYDDPTRVLAHEDLAAGGAWAVRFHVGPLCVIEVGGDGAGGELPPGGSR